MGGKITGHSCVIGIRCLVIKLAFCVSLDAETGNSHNSGTIVLRALNLQRPYRHHAGAHHPDVWTHRILP